ncbi:MAG: oxidoreductase, partial [Gammaproteobacteria bacterium]|nr:oxidoreductase [Gammaproteobacteria bacterium]
MGGHKLLSRQLWFTSPGQVEIREQPLPQLETNQVLIESLCSAISTGTEMLVFRNQLPEGMSLDTSLGSLKSQAGSYPLQYGYATVGTILETGPDIDLSITGKTVFAYAPHAS